MGGKSGFNSYPKHLGAPTGRGLRQCAASGFLRHRTDLIDDHRQGWTAKEFADITQGFGTFHPQDVVQLGALDDPKPIRDGNAPDQLNLSKDELDYSDAEIKLSIQEGRPPRSGY